MTLRVFFVAAALTLGLLAMRHASSPSPDDARALADEMLIIDGHIDLPYRLFRYHEDVSEPAEGGDFDAPRARMGGLNAAFMAIYVPTHLQSDPGASRRHADRLIDDMNALIEAHPATFAPARSPEDVQEAADEGRIALPLAMENGSGFERDLESVEYFYTRGIRYVTLTHGRHNHIGDASYDDRPPRWNGLSPFGRDVVREMNRLGMMVDISHVTDATARAVLEVSTAPVIASHSSCRHFTPGWERNLSDDLIDAIADTKGLVMINFGSNFLRGEYKAQEGVVREETYGAIDDRGWPRHSPEAFLYRHTQRRAHPIGTVADVADHVDYAVDRVGIEHVGIGSDFDGIFGLPEGLQDVSDYPNLVAELLDRGYSQDELKALFGGNLLRVWTDVETAANAS